MNRWEHIVVTAVVTTGVTVIISVPAPIIGAASGLNGCPVVGAGTPARLCPRLLIAQLECRILGAIALFGLHHNVYKGRPKFMSLCATRILYI